MPVIEVFVAQLDVADDSRTHQATFWNVPYTDGYRQRIFLIL